MADCLFCNIIQGVIPGNKAYEDDEVLAFYDVAPQAPVHILIVPKIHIDSMNDINAQNEALAGKMLRIAADLAKELDMAEGYRLVVNTGKLGGQSVNHLHYHLLGGRQLQWPPG